MDRIKRYGSVKRPPRVFTRVDELRASEIIGSLRSEVDRFRVVSMDNSGLNYIIYVLLLPTCFTNGDIAMRSPKCQIFKVRHHHRPRKCYPFYILNDR